MADTETKVKDLQDQVKGLEDAMKKMTASSSPKVEERGGSVVECRTPEREVRGSRPTSAVLCP